MFGYVMVNQGELSERDQARFAALYCGLCRTLREDYGLTGRLSLTYDMAFLTALLTALYDPETTGGEKRCIMHPLKKRAYLANGITHYAAAMNYALVRYKLRDDWADDRNLAARAGAALMDRHCARIEAAYPRQCAAMRRCLEELAKLEKENCRVIDAPANCFGALLGEIFVMREDVWSETLREMGQALGGFIYVLDACDDLERDARRGHYNPLAPLLGSPELEAGCREMLTVLMARCTAAFETLPIVEDAALLRNILYSGVWTRYEHILRRRERGGKGEKA